LTKDILFTCCFIFAKILKIRQAFSDGGPAQQIVIEDHQFGGSTPWVYRDFFNGALPPKTRPAVGFCWAGPTTPERRVGLSIYCKDEMAART